MMLKTWLAQAKRPVLSTFEASSNARLNNFDFLRLFLAVLVIFAHSYLLALGSGSSFGIANRELLWRFTHKQIDGGSLAVNGFFMISGFLIAGSWMHSRGVGSYFQKRVLRIFPGLAVALLFCIFVVGPLGGAHLSTYFTNPATYTFLETLLLHQAVLGLPGVFATNPFPTQVNGSTWTIEYELLCYVMVALLGVLGFYRKRVLVLLLFLVAFAFNYYLNRHSPAWMWQIIIPWFGYGWPLFRFDCYFLSGMTFYFYRDVIPRSRLLLAGCLLGLLVGCFHRLELVLPLCGTYVLFYAAFSRTLRAQHFGRYGDFSYGIYLYAFPVQQLLVQHWGPHLTPTTLFLLALPISSGLAALSWHFVEKPCLRLKNKPWWVGNRAREWLGKNAPEPVSP